MSLDKRAMLVLALGVSASVGLSPTYGFDHFVDAAATGPDHNGQSWCTAFLRIQDALDVVFTGDRVLVAQGTYYPDTSGLPDARDATFQLITNVRINGGYAGCAEAEPDARDLKAFETILSGDLAQDDDLPDGGIDENAYHVVTGSGADGTATLDGVTIAAGNADGSSFEGRGGGVFNFGGHPSLRNCTIRDNRAIRGAGMFNLDSSPTLFNCVIAENVSVVGSGGGIYDSAVGRANGSTLINCLIRDNQSFGLSGGGVLSEDATTVLDNCTVVGNVAVSVGGGVSVGLGANLTIRDGILWANSDLFGMNQDSQIWIQNGVASVDNSCVQGWDGTLGGVGNFGDDPLFAVGPLGCHYLSQVAAGETADSPCIDGGLNTAEANGLNLRTTRSDAVGDSGIVDLGYHYPITADVLLMGDADRNEVVDLSDYSDWFECITGPVDAGLTPCCRIADFDDDEDIDLFDVAEFANAQTEP
ncbi:MAG: right-handed parallel beta-helix repeat-containing protein [Planctomycetes bacterium]|nr:right-handed parallel beta-helix repeat-containing protein [Planctomycetota bacterium]